MQVPKVAKVWNLTPHNGPNQRQKFLAEYYRAKENPAADQRSNQDEPPKKQANTLTCSSTEGTTEENLNSEYDSSKSRSCRIEGDCMTVIRICTEKLKANPLNEKALSLRATAYLRKKDYDFVSF